MRAVELVKEGLTPERIMTEAAFRNALCLDMALGCSTNTVLHLPAIAHEAGIEFDLDWVNEASARVPNLCHLAPAGRHHVIDLHQAGGVMAVLSELRGRGLLEEGAMTVSGKTLGEEIARAKNLNPTVIRPFDDPYSPTGGLMILRGNLAPDGAVVKRSAVAAEMLVHEGPARVFDSEDEAIEAIYAGKIRPATSSSSAMRARAAAPACAKCSRPPAPSAAWALIRRWRSSRTGASPALRAARRSATFPRRRPAGGVIGLIEEGDILGHRHPGRAGWSSRSTRRRSMPPREVGLPPARM